MLPDTELCDRIVGIAEQMRLWDEAPSRRFARRGGTTTELLRLLGERRQFHQLLMRLLVDDQVADEVAARSYQHANGFAKIVLVVDPHSLGKLRLHLWQPSGAVRPMSDAHNHTWNFAAAIVSGCFVHETFVVRSGGERVQHVKYTPRGDAACFLLTPVGQVGLDMVVRERLAPGNVYVLGADTIHRFYQSGGGLGATLVIQNAPIRESTDVYLREPLPTGTVVASRAMSRAMLRRLVMQYMATIDRPKLKQ